jgi:hypothetical protein
MVHYFNSGLLIFLRKHKGVVVLPDPVGPVTTIIPFGFLACDSKI